MSKFSGWRYHVEVEYIGGSSFRGIVRGKTNALKIYNVKNRRHAKIVCYRGQIMQWSREYNLEYEAKS